MALTGNRRIRTTALLLTSIAFVAAVQLPLLAGDQVIRATRNDEEGVAASGSYVAWAEATRRHPNHHNAKAMARPGGSPFRVNRPRTEGFMGGMDDDLLVYQETRRRRSDLVLIDLSTRERSAPPDPVVSDKWDYWPSLDGGRYLLGRLSLATGRRRVLLYDDGTSNTILMAETDGWKRMLQPGQVNGDYVTWSRWTPSRCDVFFHDLDTATTTRLPNPGPRCNYAPSVSSNGTVYFARSALACGRNVRLIKYPPGGPPIALFSLPDGRDLLDTFAHDAGSGDVEVFYDPTRCRSGFGDIHMVIDD